MENQLGWSRGSSSSNMSAKVYFMLYPLVSESLNDMIPQTRLKAAYKSKLYEPKNSPP